MKIENNNKITFRNLILMALFLCPVFSITITGKVMDSKSNDVLIGAYGNDDNGSYAGHAAVFSACEN